MPLFIETHRGTITQDLLRTIAYSRQVPRMRFTLDASHYVVAGEVTQPDAAPRFTEALAEIIARSSSVHARVRTANRSRSTSGMAPAPWSAPTWTGGRRRTASGSPRRRRGTSSPSSANWGRGPTPSRARRDRLPRRRRAFRPPGAGAGVQAHRRTDSGSASRVYPSRLISIHTEFIDHVRLHPQTGAQIHLWPVDRRQSRPRPVRRGCARQTLTRADRPPAGRGRRLRRQLPRQRPGADRRHAGRTRPHRSRLQEGPDATPAWSCRWRPPTSSAIRPSRTARSPANDPKVRAYALHKTMHAIDLGVELGAKIYVFWGGREGIETDAAKTRWTRASASARR